MSDMKPKKKFLKSSVFNATEKLVRISLNFFIFILMTNTLSIEEMGKYNFYIMTFAILSVFSSFGLTESATKVLLDNRSNLKILNLLIGIKLIFSFVFASIGYFFSFDGNIFFFLGLIFSSFSLSLQYLESLGLGKIILKVNSTILFLSAIIKVWACFSGQNLNTFCLIFAVEVFVQSSLLFLISYVKGKNTHFESYINLLSKLNFRGYFLIWISASLSILYAKVDQFFVKFYLSNADVGIYMYATRIIDYSILIPSLIISSSMPYLYNLQKSSRAVIYSILIYLSVFIFLLVNLMSLILSIHFTPQYSASIFVIFVLSLGTPFALIRALTGKFMIIDGYNRPFLIRAVVLLLVNSLLCYLLMNQFGLIGLAIANMITIIFSGLFIDLIHQDTIQFFKIKCACVLNLKKPLQLLQEIKRLR